MTTKYRVIKHAPGVPIKSLELAEDILRLEQIQSLLKRIDSTNISANGTNESREFADLMLQSQQTLVKSWERYARLQLRKYLAP